MSLPLPLKKHDRFSNFHVIVRKMLAFVLKLHSFGLSLKMLQDSLTSQSSKFGHGVTIPETMVTKSCGTYCATFMHRDMEPFPCVYMKWEARDELNFGFPL